MGFYEEMRSLAVELLNEFGAPAVLTSGGSSFDKATGRPTTGTPTIQSTTAVISESQIVNDNGRQFNKINAYVADKPTIGATLTLGGRNYRVEVVDEIRPTTVELVWIIQGTQL